MIRLAGSGGSVGAFKWTSSEQVYPFALDSTGSTLYAKEYSLGTLPNNTFKLVDLELGNPASTKVHSWDAYAATNSGDYNKFQFNTIGVTLQIYQQYVRVASDSNTSYYTGFIRVVYKH